MKKNNKMLKVFICIDLVLVAIAIIGSAKTITTLKKIETYNYQR